MGSSTIEGTARLRTEDEREERARVFGTLVDRGLDDAYRLAAVILGDRIEAEDAVHDAAIVAWRGFGSLRDVARFDAWFGRILVNGCRDRLRRRARVRVRDVGRELGESEHRLQRDSSEATAAREAVQAVLAVLSADQRVVVALRFGLELTVPEIAARVGAPEGTVKSRLHHALERLRAALAAAEVTP